ncbi:D-alanyl-D-alanine-carboxypeptidase / D-alanyl-D-alanine-endopeptidase [Granulicella pectinivorans]|uniref:D-alanyl-D-alanine-carboxypeptidase / D-alanyl-D-alanine-endopeptidase n=1 Tax=Granulicella pectinivorans TaxID=474950 RepID=A0A1I6LLR9_9BACT|nr:D-alanyl-D-alanine-carboxypeptidase/endopeptidase AmpH [Granulicella pectinivorans]SFS04353.1 D-alanyl-D-alanine-carboxypeptidase / D-alanyl-D-alanine-endopeptidase [Granulicella pectinivorans]
MGPAYHSVTAARAKRFSLLVLPLLWALGGASLHAQQVPPLVTADALGAQIYTATASTGMVMVVVRDGDVFVQEYGETSPGSGQKPNEHSLVRLCSLSKIIATDLLNKLVVDGTVHFTDTLQHFAPTGGHVPTLTLHGPVVRAMTLGDLATHTSGLPREVGPTPRGVSYFAYPDHETRWAWLAKQKLATTPGTYSSYSNIGFALLGDALEEASGKPYAELFAERTAKPLGLTETTLSPTPEQCGRLMAGAHRSDACGDTQASAGAGGMYSTAADMTLWLKYLLGLPGVPVHQNSAAQAVYVDPLQLKGTKGLDHAGQPTGIGLGWLRLGYPGDPSMIIQKTGGGGGFTTYIALDPARHAGVFVAATDGTHFTHTHMFQQINNLLLAVSGLPAQPLPVDPEPVPAHRLRDSKRTRSSSPHSNVSHSVTPRARAKVGTTHQGRASRRQPSQ